MSGSDDLDELQHEIDEVKSHRPVHEHDIPPQSGVPGTAMQTATHFIAGAAVGSAAGYFLDRWLGTTPILFLFGFFLGFAASIYKLMVLSAKK